MTSVAYSGIHWNVEPKKVKVLYAKCVHTVIVIELEYLGTREIPWEPAATMWQG